MLKVEYRSQTDGSILGQKTFLHQGELSDRYLADEVMWWKGEREGRTLSYVCHFRLQDSSLSGELMYLFTYEASRIPGRLGKA